LVDIEGRVVGINTMISSQSGGSEGIGFAVPGNIVATVFDQLRRLGRVVRGEIGVAGQTVTPGLAKGLGLATQTGVIISDVALGSTAGLAGLKPDDIVISLDGKPMENLRQLKVNLYRKTGDVATLEVLRGSENLKLRVIVKEKASDTGRLASLVNPSEHLVQEIGVFAIPAQDPRLGEVKTRPGEGGLVVAGMAAGRSPDESSPVPGDVIYAVNRQRVSTVAELRSALDELGHGPAVLRVERGGVLLYLEVELD
jgi:S1-C subfamily serine protease